jgi:hypothetical protein
MVNAETRVNVYLALPIRDDSKHHRPFLLPKMVLAFLLLPAQFLFGLSLSSFFLSSSFSFWPIVAVAIPSGIGFSSFFYFLFSSILGHHIFHLLIHMVMLLYFAALLFKRGRIPKYQFRISDLLVVILYLAAFSALFCSAYLRNGNSLPIAVLTNLYEELSIVASFSAGLNGGLTPLFNFENPVQRGSKIETRWLAAFHSSMLRIGFCSVRLSVVVPSILYGWSFSILLYFLGLEFKVSPFLSFFAPFLLVLVAGYGVFDLWHTPISDPRLDHVSYTKTGPTEFRHPTLHVLLAQRSSALAFSIAATIFLSFTKLFRFPRSMTPLSLLYIGTLIGLLPAVDAQAFIGLTIFAFIALTCATFSRARRCIPFFLAGYSASTLLHLPRLLPVLRELRVRPLWERSVKSGAFFPALKYCFSWLGFFPFVAFLLPFFIGRVRQFELTATALLTFCASLHLSLSPVSFDCFTAHFAVFPFASVLFLSVIHGFSTHRSLPEEVRGFVAAAGMTLFLFNIASSAVGLGLQISRSTVVWGEEELALADWIRRNTARGSVFIGVAKEMSPVTALAGRVAFLAPRDTAAALGIDREGRLREASEWCSVPDNDKKLVGVDYFLKKNGERGQPCDGISLNRARWKEATKIGNYTVWKQIHS